MSRWLSREDTAFYSCHSTPARPPTSIVVFPSGTIHNPYTANPGGVYSSERNHRVLVLISAKPSESSPKASLSIRALVVGRWYCPRQAQPGAVAHQSQHPCGMHKHSHSVQFHPVAACDRCGGRFATRERVLPDLSHRPELVPKAKRSKRAFARRGGAFAARKENREQSPEACLVSQQHDCQLTQSTCQAQ